MPRKKPKSLNPEFAARKEQLAEENKTRRASSLRRVRRAAGPVEASSVGTWASLPISDKAELVMSWSINGGSLHGRRYSRLELRQSLGLTDGAMTDLVARCEREFLRVYEENGALSKLVAKAITKTFYQLEFDRGRVIQHTELLGQELQACLAALRQAESSLKSAKGIKYRLEYWKRVSRFWSVYGQLSEQQTEVLKVLNNHNEAAIRFIEIFNKKHGPGSEDTPTKDQGKPLTMLEAYKLIEENSPQILPSQKVIEGRVGSRDPDEAFKHLQKPDA